MASQEAQLSCSPIVRNDSTSSMVIHTNVNLLQMLTGIKPLLPTATTKRSPIPSLSFSSLNPFSNFKSGSSSPSSVYLSPPASSPTFMSPPPRHEVDDYLASGNLHGGGGGGKRKRLTRGSSYRKSSPLAGSTFSEPSLEDIVSPRDIPIAVGKIDTSMPEVLNLAHSLPARPSVSGTSDQWNQQNLDILPVQDKMKAGPGQAEPHYPPQPIPSVIGQYEEMIHRSPATESLRRLSQADGESLTPTFSDANGTSQPTMINIPQTLTQSSDAISAPNDSTNKSEDLLFKLRRSSTAPSSRDRRRPKKHQAGTVSSDLAIPVTITLRKATRFFPSLTGSAGSGEVPTRISRNLEQRPSSQPLSCTLVGFRSQQLENSNQTDLESDNDKVEKVPSSFATASEISKNYPDLMKSESKDFRRQSLAEPAITVADILPSPAVLTSPTKTTMSSNEPERRLSVVQITSRNSVHQIIWQENESSSSNSSSRPVSPTGSGSTKLGESNENSPSHKSSVNSKLGSEQSPITAFGKWQIPRFQRPERGEFAVDTNETCIQERPDSLWTREMDDPPALSPGESSGGPEPIFNSLNVEVPATPYDNDDHEIESSLPRFIFDEDDTEMSPTSYEPAKVLVRRGSFVIGPGSLAAPTGMEREAGSRRSISLQPFSVVRLGDREGTEDALGLGIQRRMSTMDGID